MLPNILSKYKTMVFYHFYQMNLDNLSIAYSVDAARKQRSLMDSFPGALAKYDSNINKFQ